jgi:hypothetical protein
MKSKAALSFWLFPVLLSLSLGACSSSTPSVESELIIPSQTSEVAPTLEVTPTPKVPTETPHPVMLENIQYQIRAELDYPNRVVYVDETILIPHPSDNPLDELVLVVPPAAWWDVFHLLELKWAGSGAIDNYALEGVLLRIPLPDPWLPGEERQLNILFRLDLPIQNAREGFGPSPFGYTAIQTNLVDWYPMVPPYQEEYGWIVHEPWIFGEYLVYPLADFQVTLDVGNPSLVVAASSPGEQEGDLYQYQLKEARNFVFSISPDYHVLEGDANGTRVYGYVFPTYLTPGQAAFDATLEALALYSELFGTLQQPSLSMIQADFNHGMEYEGLYFQSRGFFDTYTGSVQSYLITIAVHETAHQWWYGEIANDQALEPWLDEALCTFSELLYYERLHPEDVDWWWATRVNYYQPEGVINRSIYGYREFIDQYLTYRNATYLQGAKFFVQLRSSLGEELFYSFLRDYVSSFEKGIVTGDDFFALLGEYVEVDSLQWLGEYFGE